MESTRKSQNKKAGFSLVEVLVALAITIIVVYGAFTFFEEQRKTFRQQSEQANSQANLRLALYYLAQDIALAGYSGTPFGVETTVYRAVRQGTIDNFPVRVINPIKVKDNMEPEIKELRNSEGNPLDAIELWANFEPNGTAMHLLTDAAMGSSFIIVPDVSIFMSTIQLEDGSTLTVYPTGVLIASLRNDASGRPLGGEYHTIVSIDPTARIINLGTVLENSFFGGIDWVAPIYRRKYFVQEVTENLRTTRWLIRRDYYVNNRGIPFFDFRLAEGVEDLQILLDIRDPVANQIDMDVEPATEVDCCHIIGVSVQISGLVHTPDTKLPVIHTLSRRIKLNNINNFGFLDNCGACLTQL